jgi:hypothetical protein
MNARTLTSISAGKDWVECRLPASATKEVRVLRRGLLYGIAGVALTLGSVALLGSGAAQRSSATPGALLPEVAVTAPAPRIVLDTVVVEGGVSSADASAAPHVF